MVLCLLLRNGFLQQSIIEQRGNPNIILSERGIRSFDASTRNVLDTSAIAFVKHTSRYPVLADPSHATVRSDLVLPAARVAIGAGTDGLLVEFHADPDSALSDGEQLLALDTLPEFFQEVSRAAGAMGRSFA